MNTLRYKVARLLVLVMVVFGSFTEIAMQINAEPVTETTLKYRDYSQDSGQYHPLQGLSLKATTVVFEGLKKEKVLSTELEFSQYRIVAPVRVQTSCNYVSGTFDTAVAKYTLRVAADSKNIVRKEMLRQMRGYWKAKDAEELRDYKYLPAEKYLWMQSGCYVLYQEPGNEWEGATYLFYASGKVVQVIFDEFESGGGWGGLSSFVTDNVLFKFADTQIRCGYTTDISPQQFFAKDKNGYFDKPPKTLVSAEK